MKSVFFVCKHILNESLNEQNKNISKIKTYVGSDGKIHFVDSAGADSVLPFKKGTDTSDATAIAADITIGKTAYVNGVKITGNRPAAASRIAGYKWFGGWTSGSTLSYLIQFSPPFDSVPNIALSLTPADGVDSWKYEPSYSDVTRTGFKLSCKNNTGGGWDCTVNWAAST